MVTETIALVWILFVGIGIGSFIRNWARQFDFNRGKFVLISSGYPVSKYAGRLAVVTNYEKYSHNCALLVYNRPSENKGNALAVRNNPDQITIHTDYLKVWSEQTKKGGGKRMPRIFRWAWYLLFFMIGWNLYVHMNDIALFLTNHFLGAK